MAPTRSPSEATRKAASAATSAATTDFVARRLPKNIDEALVDQQQHAGGRAPRV